MLFVFAALLALVAGQCDLAGTTYMNADGRSLTFGHPVGDWAPGLINWGTDGISFATWSQATIVRYEVQEFGSTSGDFCDIKGSYNLEFSSDCSVLKFVAAHDSCPARFALFRSEFTLHELADSDNCASAGSTLTTMFQESAAWSRISGDNAAYVFGVDQYAVVSVSTRAAIVQRWRLNANGHGVEVVDLDSWPKGFACPTTQVGEYVHVADWDDTCAVRFCGVADACVGRAQLLHNAPFNNFEGDRCSNIVVAPTDGRATSCSDGRQWLKHPDSCVAQDVEGGCAFCSGIAMGESFQYCINRQGAGCEDIFESSAHHAFCNLEFECPASTATISFVVFISSLLALFLH